MLLMLVPLAVVLVVSVRLDFRSSMAPTMAAFDSALVKSALGLAAQIRLDGNALVLRLDRQAEQILRSDTTDVVIWALYDNVGLLAGGIGACHCRSRSKESARSTTPLWMAVRYAWHA